MREAFLGFLVFSLLLFVGLPSAGAQSSRVETIAAVVNEDAVSESDVMDRMRLIITSSGMKDSREIRERMKPQILNMLIEEKLKLQEAERLEIEIAEEDIAEGFARIAGQNNMSPEKFRGLLSRSGVSRQSLEDQIRSQIAWSRVVQVRLRPQVNVADNEVDAVLERMRASQGKAEYRVSEIFLPVEKPSEEADVKRLADRLIRQLRDSRVPFPRLASQFSQSAGAAKGGDMGWVQEGQLSETLDDMLAQMKEGEFSRPVRSLSGYHILYLRDVRRIAADTLPSREQITQNLGMERLDRLQKSYLLDLKTEAFIENRV